MRNSTRRHFQNVKSQQLGMDHGQAGYHIRRLITFQLVQETGRDICYECGHRILCADDMSVDHKIPWLHVDPDLFWDLDNIAFSHKGCNRPNLPSRKEATEKYLVNKRRRERRASRKLLTPRSHVHGSTTKTRTKISIPKTRVLGRKRSSSNRRPKHRGVQPDDGS